MNGRSVNCDSPVLTYGDVVELAGHARTRVLSVTYQGPRSGDSSRAGTLTPGKVVAIADGFIFNVADTSNA